MAGQAVGAGLRVVSVSVLGRPAKRLKANGKRLDLLATVIDELAGQGWGAEWGRLDAVLWPGGFLYLDEPLAALEGSERTAALQDGPLGPACLDAAFRLNACCGGALLAMGLRGPKSERFGGEQLMAAWSADGVVGSAAKVFPSHGDAEGKRPLLVHLKEPGDPQRSVRLACGAAAALCVCYDAFAFAEARLGPTGKRSALNWVSDGHEPRRPKLHEQREAVDCYVAAVERKRPALVLAAVHHFELPGRETYWQRHGIATASAALGGALVVGAAHFEDELPDEDRPGHGVLASVGVPRRHLSMGLHRPARRLEAVRSRRIEIGGKTRLAALVRLFESPAT